MSVRTRRLLGAAALIAPMLAGALAPSAAADEAEATTTDSEAAAELDRPTTVYTLSNDPAGNAVLVFKEAGGRVVPDVSVPTGGLGLGSGLGSQGAVIVEGQRLLAVNAGSDELSLFRLGPNGRPVLSDVEPTGGDRPVSVDVHGDVVYVLNAGDSTVSGFRIRGQQLVAIPAGHRVLPGSGGAQISFDRSGSRLVVTQKATNTIDVLPVRNGVAGEAVSNPSVGQTPFGFAIDARNHVIVSNAAGGAAQASSVSTYGVSGPSGLSPISSAVATTQTAACWVALSENGRYAYTTNTGSGSISSYRVAPDGSVTLLEAAAALPGAGPLDIDIQDRDVFTLNNGSHTISLHRMFANGSLRSLGQVPVPVGAVGLATY